MGIDIVTKVFLMFLANVFLTHPSIVYSAAIKTSVNPGAISDGAPLKKVLTAGLTGENLLDPDAWRPWQTGFEVEDSNFIFDNASDAQVQRGVSQTVQLKQTKPEPIVAVAWSRADAVGGGRDSNYSLYLDLVYSDDSPLWGQVAPFNVGTHDWEKAQVVVFPEKPVKSVSFHRP